MSKLIIIIYATSVKINRVDVCEMMISDNLIAIIIAGIFTPLAVWSAKKEFDKKQRCENDS